MGFSVEGSWPALVTPFHGDDTVNLEALRRLVGFHVENGSQGVLILGSTGEAIMLSQEERKRIIDTVLDEANGRIPVMVGVAAVSTRQTIENARYALEAGADAGLVVQPPYIKPRQDSLYHYFKEVASSVDLPLVIYNNPERCGVNVEPETVARLAQHPNIVALKEAGPNPYGVLRVLELTRGRLNVLCCDCAFYALIPVVTVAGLSLGRLLAGALVVENLFYLPGLGRLALAAVRARDLPLLSGAGLVVAGLILLLNLAVDLAYGALDPRIRYR